MRRAMTRLMACSVVALTAVAGGAAEPAGQFRLVLRKRVEIPGASGQFRVVEEPVTWDAHKTAIIVCDMWARHWCRSATARCAEMAPRMNAFLAEARKRGALIIHAPSGGMEFYKDHPARRRAQQAPKAPELPAEIASGCSQLDAEKRGTWPIDQSDGGCDDQPPCPMREANMDLHQTPFLEIRDEDAISDSGVECWNLMAQRGISNVMLVGVHTNMCVVGRPFGLRNMVRFGKNAVLVRDLTDTMYNPRRKPFVSHFRGTELIVEHIEKYICPTISSDQLLGGQPFRFRGQDIANPAGPERPCAAAPRQSAHPRAVAAPQGCFAMRLGSDDQMPNSGRRLANWF